MKIEDLISSVKSLSFKVVLYFYMSIMLPSKKYCCHIWAGAPNCNLNILIKLQKRYKRLLAPSFEPLAHCQNVGSLGFFYRYYFGKYSFELD